MSVMSFLAGLDPQFEAAKSQILSSTEVPSLKMRSTLDYFVPVLPLL